MMIKKPLVLSCCMLAISVTDARPEISRVIEKTVCFSGVGPYLRMQAVRGEEELFLNENEVQRFLERVGQLMTSHIIPHCEAKQKYGPPSEMREIQLYVGSNSPVAPFDKCFSRRSIAFRAIFRNGHWDIKKNEFRSCAARLERRAAKEARAKRAAVAKEKRRRAALGDCGLAPKISGGPWFAWFSSTYSIAAKDAARRRDFLCVKTVEYVSPAPNPFGGNAARARFVGYDSVEYMPKTLVSDFPY